MEETLDEYLDNLQEQIFKEAIDAYGDEGFDRWQHPRFRGEIEKPHGFARMSGTCGDTMEIYLMFKVYRVEQASYITDGCGSSNVCGSFAAEMCHGKMPEELLDMSHTDILNRLGNLPKEEEHCAYLAARTVQEAAHDFMTRGLR